MYEESPLEIEQMKSFNESRLLEKVDTELNTVDIFTKPLAVSRLDKLSNHPQRRDGDTLEEHICNV